LPGDQWRIGVKVNVSIPPSVDIDFEMREKAGAEQFRQARPVWDRAAEMILVAATTGRKAILPLRGPLWLCDSKKKIGSRGDKCRVAHIRLGRPLAAVPCYGSSAPRVANVGSTASIGC
jgi:hypothetical protein